MSTSPQATQMDVENSAPLEENFEEKFIKQKRIKKEKIDQAISSFIGKLGKGGSALKIFKIVPRERGSAYKSPQDHSIDDKVQKSLEELAKNFITHFTHRENVSICLNEVVEVLGVERRRIYDILNIFEGLQLAEKRGKNNYFWKGLKNLSVSIQEVSNLESFDEEICHKSQIKKRSLESLSIKFVALFLNWKSTLTLEEAARRLSEDQDESRIRTKIRRLYDIVNVLKSIGLIEKVSLPEKKPALRWVGLSGVERTLGISNLFNSEPSDAGVLTPLQTNQKPKKTAISDEDANATVKRKKNISKNEEVYSFILESLNTGNLNMRSALEILGNGMSPNLQSFQFNKIIQRPLTIIEPKRESFCSSPESALKGFEEDSKNEESEGDSKAPCKRNLMNSYLFDVSEKSSFKKIKRNYIISPFPQKENICGTAI